jgi:RNA-directed DNA polymerase
MFKERRDSQYVNQSKRASKTSAVKLYTDYARIDWIHELSLNNKEVVFSNLMHHVNPENLKVAFRKLDRHKAYGIDRVSKEEYERNLQSNIDELSGKIAKSKWYPKPSREVLIPKANGGKRPIAIGCTEDKVVQNMVATILEAIYEPIFSPFSYGFRRNKNTHQGINQLYDNIIDKNKNCYVVELDIEKFFNMVDHKKLVELLKIKIKDERFITLIIRLLKNSILSQDGEIRTNVLGTPQGSPVSPMLANIFLHYVVDEWFMEKHSKRGRMVRYADDLVFVFGSKEEALQFNEAVTERLSSYGLKISKEKSKIIRFDAELPEGEVNFLGFSFYWGIAKFSSLILKIKTNLKKLNACIQDFKEWIKAFRNSIKLEDIWKIVTAKFRGHFNYFGVKFNSNKLNHYYQACLYELFKWLNRRSQKKSYTWTQFCNRLKHCPLPKPPQGFELKNIGRKWKHTLKSRMRENRKYGSERSSGANPVFT